jgi:hypothetical protein
MGANDGVVAGLVGTLKSLLSPLATTPAIWPNLRQLALSAKRKQLTERGVEGHVRD